MKTDNLLIGNGVNLNGSHLFTSREIINWIKKTLHNGFYFLRFDNNISFLSDIIEYFDFDNFSGNIEELLSQCFKLVINKSQSYFKNLSEIRCLELSTLLKRVFINAMFVKNSQLINIEIPDDITRKIKSYKKVFTTNYHEYWDENDKAIYLHGKIFFTQYERSDYGIDEERVTYDIEYNSAMEDYLAEKYYFPIENIEDIIMLPSGYKNR